MEMKKAILREKGLLSINAYVLIVLDLKIYGGITENRIPFQIYNLQRKIDELEQRIDKLIDKIDSSNMLAYYVVYPLIKKIKFAELRTRENILAGVMIIYDNSPRYVCLAEIGYNKNIQGASDILFATFLNKYFNKSEVISLGGSETEGIFRNKKHFFKKFEKWYEYPCCVLIEYKKKGSQWNDDFWIDKMRKK